MLSQQDDCDDIPPLEDMSEALNQKLKLYSSSYDTKEVVSSYLEVDDDMTVEKKKHEQISNMMANKTTDIPSTGKTTKLKEKNRQKENANFCGFKKGFLQEQQSKPTKKKSGLIEVKMVDKEVDNKNILPEVQSAMNNQIPLLQSKDWITSDLLTKIMKNPKLAHQFNDPKFNEAITLFQTNPQKVLEMCKDNVELREFIQEFCALMGDHFTNLADINEESSSRKTSSNMLPTNNNDISKEDDSKIKDILSNEDTVKALQSPDIQKLLSLLRSNPMAAQRFIDGADSALRQKMQRLVDVGLLQFTTG